MRLLLFSFIFSSVLVASSYDCELKVRDDLMDPFEVKTAMTTLEKPIEIHNKGYRLKVQTVPVDGRQSFVMWLGTDSRESAVTLGTMDQPKYYLNVLQGDHFAVAECLLQGGR